MITFDQRSELAQLTGFDRAAFGSLARTRPDPHMQRVEPWGGSLFFWEIDGRIFRFAAYQLVNVFRFMVIVGTPVAPDPTRWVPLITTLMTAARVLR